MILDRLTIRARITLGTFLLAGLFFAGTALVVQRSLESVLDTATATLLETDAAPFVDGITREPGDALDLPTDGQLVAVTDATGQIVQSSLPAVLADRVSRLPPDGDVVHTVETGGASYQVRVMPVSTPDGTWTVITARNDAASDLIEDRLTAGLLIGLVVLTLMFGGASWVLTGAALRPVGRLRRSAESLLDTPGSDLLAIGSAHDEVSDLAATLNSLIGSLRDATERERQMVSDASHELRTPVAILQSQLELIRTGDRSTLDADIAAAERATRRLAHLVSTLLELSRIEAKPERGHATVGGLADELAESVDRARYSARNLNVTVDFDVEATGTSASVPLAAHSFGRIVDNLVQNAVAAVGTAGEVTATLRDTGEEVVLTVADSGPGMPGEFLPRAFDRFSRASASRADVTRGTTGQPRHGTGLGLAIVHALVSSAGGTIRLDNVADAGLLVTVRLPRHPPIAS